MSLETLTIVIIVLSLASIAAPIVGRFVAPWAPRLSESLIRLGTDLLGAARALSLPAGVYPPSAEPFPTPADLEPEVERARARRAKLDSVRRS